MIQENIARARKILQESGDECNIFLASAIFSCIYEITVNIIIIYPPGLTPMARRARAHGINLGLEHWSNYDESVGRDNKSDWFRAVRYVKMFISLQ